MQNVIEIPSSPTASDRPNERVYLSGKDLLQNMTEMRNVISRNGTKRALEKALLPSWKTLISIFASTLELVQADHNSVLVTSLELEAYDNLSNTMLSLIRHLRKASKVQVMRSEDKSIATSLLYDAEAALKLFMQHNLHWNEGAVWVNVGELQQILSALSKTTGDDSDSDAPVTHVAMLCDGETMRLQATDMEVFQSQPVTRSRVVAPFKALIPLSALWGSYQNPGIINGMDSDADVLLKFDPHTLRLNFEIDERYERDDGTIGGLMTRISLVGSVVDNFPIVPHFDKNKLPVAEVRTDDLLKERHDMRSRHNKDDILTIQEAVGVIVDLTKPTGRNRRDNREGVVWLTFEGVSLTLTGLSSHMMSVSEISHVLVDYETRICVDGQHLLRALKALDKKLPFDFAIAEADEGPSYLALIQQTSVLFVAIIDDGVEGLSDLSDYIEGQLDDPKDVLSALKQLKSLKLSGKKSVLGIPIQFTGPDTAITPRMANLSDETAVMVSSGVSWQLVDERVSLPKGGEAHFSLTNRVAEQMLRSLQHMTGGSKKYERKVMLTLVLNSKFDPSRPILKVSGRGVSNYFLLTLNESAAQYRAKAYSEASVLQQQYAEALSEIRQLDNVLLHYPVLSNVNEVQLWRDYYGFSEEFASQFLPHNEVLYGFVEINQAIRDFCAASDGAWSSYEIANTSPVTLVKQEIFAYPPSHHLPSITSKNTYHVEEDCYDWLDKIEREEALKNGVWYEWSMRNLSHPRREKSDYDARTVRVRAMWKRKSIYDHLMPYEDLEYEVAESYGRHVPEDFVDLVINRPSQLLDVKHELGRRYKLEIGDKLVVDSQGSPVVRVVPQRGSSSARLIFF